MLGFRSLGFVAFMLFTAFSNAADADSSDDDWLNLDWSAVCTGDNRTMGECANRQEEKADRWLQAVLESYERVSAGYMTELKEEGTEPFDQVAQLWVSQTLFEKFRRAAADQVHTFGYPGSGSAIEGARAYFRLTVERVRFLLSTCNYRRDKSLPKMIDLTVTNWCEAQ